MPLGRQGGPKKAARKRFALNTRRAKEAKLYLRGKTQAKIAEVVGVSQVTVSNDLNALDRERREQAVSDVRIRREKQLKRLYAQLALIDREIARNDEQDTITRQEVNFGPAAAGPDGKPLAAPQEGRRVVQTSSRRGGFKGLQEVRASVERLVAEIEGNYAPSKRALTDGEGNPLDEGTGSGGSLFEDVLVIRRRIIGHRSD